MSELIERKIVECFQAVDGLHRSLGDPIESLLNLYGKRYYDLLDEGNKGLISLELFKEKVLEYTVEKDPPKVLKDLRIEPWLEPVWRGNDSFFMDQLQKVT